VLKIHKVITFHLWVSEAQSCHFSFYATGTVVPGDLMFYCWRFFLFFTARSPSFLGRSTWNFATWSEVCSSWFGVTERMISDNFGLRSRTSLERIERLTSGKWCYQLQSLPRSAKKIWWTLVHWPQIVLLWFKPTQDHHCACCVAKVIAFEPRDVARSGISTP